MAKKLWTLSAIIFTSVIMISGCFNGSTASDKGNGVKLSREGNSLVVTAEKSIAGGELYINKVLSESNVVVEEGTLKIVKNTLEGTKVAVVVPGKNIEAGTKIVEIENCPVGVSVSIKTPDENAVKATVKRGTDSLLGDFATPTLTDGQVDLQDFGKFSAAYGQNGSGLECDIAPATKGTGAWANIFSQKSPDGTIDIFDLVVFGWNYGRQVSGNTDQADVDALKTALTFEVIKGSNTDINAVTSNLSLGTVLGNSVSVTWVSNNTSVISNTGVVTRPLPTATDAIVKLTALLSKGGATPTTTDITVTVKKQDANLDQVAVDEAVSLINFDLIKNSNSSATGVTSNLSFPSTVGTKGVLLTWTTDKTSTVSNTGVVTRPSFSGSDTAVVVTVTISKGTAVAKQPTISIIVLKETTNPDQTDVDAAVSLITFDLIKNANTSQTGVTTNLTLPSTVGTKNVAVTWSSSNTTVVANNGVVTRPTAADAPVTLTATLTKGTAQSKQPQVSVTVTKAVNQDQIDVDAAVALITFNLIKNANTNPAQVTTALTFPTTVGTGVTATWTTNNTSVISNTGAVTRPLSTAADATVEITATLSKGTATSKPGKVPVTVTKQAAATIAPFKWDNANVYFVITDRFYNGDNTNDTPYGRINSNVPKVGTFHGGDIKGLTAKLDYLDKIGVNAIWMTAPYEQIHGWVGGATGNTFPHYAYHGYYALDFTTMDKNMGTVEEMRTFVKEAHKRGIRVIMDIVMNHVGYNTLLDAVQYQFSGAKTMNESAAASWTSGDGYHSNFNYADGSLWNSWWGSSWIRAGVSDIYKNGVMNDAQPLVTSTGSLPDIKTEVTNSVGLPPILVTKWGKETSGFDNWINPSAKALRKDLGIAPAGYTVKWLAAWVEEFGIDGFRVDTAKHVDLYRWKELKDASNAALTAWRASSRSDGDEGKSWTDAFWMTGEHWNFNNGGGGHTQGDYYTGGGFDTMIDFGYKGKVSGYASTYNSMMNSFNNVDKKLFPYISSHDTGNVFYSGDNELQKMVGTALLLRPGAVQTFYGDEIGRANGDGGGDKDQGSRSDFEWTKVDNDINVHWAKIGKFRKNHIAVGAGTHSTITATSFSRILGDDKVVISLGSSEVDVSSVFADGTVVRDAYSGATATVTGGLVVFTVPSSPVSAKVILIEQVK